MVASKGTRVSLPYERNFYSHVLLNVIIFLMSTMFASFFLSLFCSPFCGAARILETTSANTHQQHSLERTNAVALHEDDSNVTTEDHHPFSSNHTDAVFASSFVLGCEHDKARDALRVQSVLDVDSYSGFITVNARYNSNLFFWFILSQQNPSTDPIIVWLMGWPGYSSMYAVFQENGPFEFVEANLANSNRSWTRQYNMLYVDNPVGIGYSFTENTSGFSRSQEAVAENLYEFLLQFYNIFPTYRRNQLYVGGESYGSKFAVSLAYVIHEKNPLSHSKMNLAGLFVGNGFLDPVNMLEYSVFLYQLGVIDYQAFLWMQKLENDLARRINMRAWREALHLHDQIHKKLKDVGFEHPFDFTTEKSTLLSPQVSKYLNEPETRKLLHVGDVQFKNDDMVYVYLEQDVLQSVKYKIEELLPHYRTLFYCGQFDILVTCAKTNSFTRRLRWSDADLFAKQRPYNWYIGEEVAGYVKSISNLTEVLVRNANHMAAASKSHFLYHLLRLFTTEGTLNENSLKMNLTD